MSNVILNSVDERGIATLRLNRPEVNNAFDDQLVAALSEAIGQFAANRDVRAVVLSGEGKNFCAGADLNWMQKMATADRQENRADALRLARLLRQLNYLPKPTVAKVQGAALGGGAGLLACCDTVIAAQDCKFGFTEGRLGLVPAVISPYVLRKIGESATRHYFVNAEIFDTDTALRLGLAHISAAVEELDHALERHIELLLNTGPQASRHAKHLVDLVAGRDEQKQLELDCQTADLIAEIRSSDEGREGLAAFLEKRAASWTIKN